MKSLFLGILLIILVGFGGLVYRNVVEHPAQKVACPIETRTCPDGTAVARTGLSCTFPPCPPPNVSLSAISISFALPDGFVPAELADTDAVAAYEKTLSASTSESARITIRRFPITASSTALSTIQKSAISGPSGLPVSPTLFTSTVLGSHRFTVVNIERFEGVLTTAYYLARATDVLRFDAIDTGVREWMNPNLDEQSLPAHAALIALLASLQGQ